MQTFLPFSSFSESAKVLDRQRLGSQRNEAYLALKTIILSKTYPDRKFPWQSHIICRIWKDYELQLFDYLERICYEWHDVRGYEDSVLEKSKKELLGWCCVNCKDGVHPKWLGNEKFHSSHRAALLAKNYGFYSKYGWAEKPEINYVWPKL